MARTLDLNADVGEGYPDDEELLDVVTSANVACGFHAGDAATMRELCGWCAERGVAVGAQVSYRDRAGFGRRAMEIGYVDLLAVVLEQLTLLEETAASQATTVAYLKPHGALYNRIVSDHEQARAVVDAAATMGLPVLGLPGSVFVELARARGLRAVKEFFADRAYTSGGALVPRSQAGALVTEPAVVAGRVEQLVDNGTVTAVDGSNVEVQADSICVHGDTAGAVRLARVVAAVLAERSITLRPFR